MREDVGRRSQMSAIAKKIFLLLIFSQVLHSIEEYVYSLWEVFTPARIVSSLVSTNLPLGFAILNVMIIAFGIWSFLVPVQRSSDSVPPIVWFWIVLELVNGGVHIFVAAASRAYFPGVYTAPLLLLFSITLLYSVSKSANAN